MIFENFGVQSMTGGVLSVSEYPVTKWLYLTLNGTLIYMGNKAKDVPGTQKPYQNNGFLSNAYGQITFVLPKDWKIELNAMYQGPYRTVFSYRPHVFANGGIKKHFWKNQATVTLNVNDIFGTFANNLTFKTEEAIQYAIDQKPHLQK